MATEEATGLHVASVQLERLRARVVGRVEEDSLLDVLAGDVGGGDDDVVQAHLADRLHLVLGKHAEKVEEAGVSA